MGVPVDGLPVVGFTRMDNWGDLCTELLGHRPPAKDVGSSKNIVVLCEARLKASWLAPLTCLCSGMLDFTY